jgi:hypothetical protein
MAWRHGAAYSQDLRDRVFTAFDSGIRVGRIAEMLFEFLQIVGENARTWVYEGDYIFNSAFAVSGERIAALMRKRDLPDQIILFELSEETARVIARHDLADLGVPQALARPGLAVGRGETLHIVRNDRWFQLPVDAVPA